jgi:hypothetical protein
LFVVLSECFNTPVRRWDEALRRELHGTSEMVTAFWPGNMKAGNDITVTLFAGYAFLKTSRNSRMIFAFKHIS